MSEWRKSSYSGIVDDEVCIELARLPDSVGLRDSKHPEAGHLSLYGETFSRFLSLVKRG